MALIFEGMAAAAARADRSVKFEATEGEQNGPYDPHVFILTRASEHMRGTAMTVDGTVIKVYFKAQPLEGDELTWE